MVLAIVTSPGAVADKHTLKAGRNGRCRLVSGHSS